MKQKFSTDPVPAKAGITFDEISLSTEARLDNHGRMVGYCDLGAGFQAEKKGNETMANQALVLMAVGLNKRFRVPFYYGFMKAVQALTKVEILKRAITYLKEHANVDTCFVTCDGLSANMETFRLLGAKIDDVLKGSYSREACSFPNPSTPEGSPSSPVYVIFDPSHMLKLARNKLKKYKTFYWENVGKVEWKYIQRLYEVQAEMRGLHLANKLTRDCVEFESSKMKVRLAARTFSSSVAKSIRYLRQTNEPGFEDSEPTCQFLETMDVLFDLMNSSDLNNPRW
jgi:hypothetical protein